MSIETLHKRNTETVELVLRQYDAKFAEMQETIQRQHAALSDAVNRLSELERRLGLMHSEKFGHGPTVR